MSKFKESQLNPSNWFLKGKDKERFNATRELRGEALEHRLAQINYSDAEITEKLEHLDIKFKYGHLQTVDYEKKRICILLGMNTPEADVACLEIDKTHGNITPIEFEKKKANILTGVDTNETKLAHVDIDRKYGVISQIDSEREKATILNEPYITVVKVHIDPEKPSDGAFELDWNKKFVEDLIVAGYLADTPEKVVNMWFDEVCANVARENGAVFPNEMEEFKHKMPRKVKSETGKVELT